MKQVFITAFNSKSISAFSEKLKGGKFEVAGSTTFLSQGLAFFA